MLCTLALVVSLSAAPATAPTQLAQSVLGKKKSTKKTKPKPTTTTTPPQKTMEMGEGLDLSQPTTPAPEQAPAPVEPPKEEPPAPAQPAWSIITPTTAGEGQNLFEAQIGFPGVYAAYWRGVLPALDLGARLGINYFQEGQIAPPQFGIRFQAQGRYRLFESGNLSVGVNFKPGLLFYFPPVSTARVGLTFPVGATLGINLSPTFNLSVTFDVPLWVQFGTGTAIPMLVGGGAEYFLSDTLALWAALKLGPTLWTNGAYARFTLDVGIGVGWHL